MDGLLIAKQAQTIRLMQQIGFQIQVQWTNQLCIKVQKRKRLPDQMSALVNHWL